LSTMVDEIVRLRRKEEEEDEIRIGMAADWGAGTREADYVQQLMVKDYHPHYTLHLGDI